MLENPRGDEIDVINCSDVRVNFEQEKQLILWAYRENQEGESQKLNIIPFLCRYQ